MPRASSKRSRLHPPAGGPLRSPLPEVLRSLRKEGIVLFIPLLLAAGNTVAQSGGGNASGAAPAERTPTAEKAQSGAPDTRAELPAAFVVVKDARDVSLPKDPIDSNSLSVSYKVKAVYPASDVITEIRTRLEASGWKPLPREGVSRMMPSSLKVGWRSHVLDRPVHESFVWSAQWGNSAGDAVSYTLMYSSGQPPVGRESPKPDNDDLSVHASLNRNKLVRTVDLPSSLIVLDGARDVMAERQAAFDQIVFGGSGQVVASRDPAKAAEKTIVIYTVTAPRPPAQVMSTLDERLGKQGWTSEAEKPPPGWSAEE